MIDITTYMKRILVYLSFITLPVVYACNNQSAHTAVSKTDNQYAAEAVIASDSATPSFAMMQERILIVLLLAIAFVHSLQLTINAHYPSSNVKFNSFNYIKVTSTIYVLSTR